MPTPNVPTEGGEPVTPEPTDWACLGAGDGPGGPIWVGHPRPGDRVRLIHTTDPFTDLQPGALGTVTNVDSAGTVDVSWDSGSTLGLLPNEDEWEVLA